MNAVTGRCGALPLCLAGRFLASAVFVFRDRLRIPTGAAMVTYLLGNGFLQSLQRLGGRFHIHLGRRPKQRVVGLLDTADRLLRPLDFRAVVGYAGLDGQLPEERVALEADGVGEGADHGARSFERLEIFVSFLYLPAQDADDLLLGERCPEKDLNENRLADLFA